MRKFYLVFIAIVATCSILEGMSAIANRGIRPTVNVSLVNQRMRKNPKIRASDVQFDLETAKSNRTIKPTIENLSTEVAILINNLYKRRELDEVNVRSLMRIRGYLAVVYGQTTQERLKNRIREAIREITEELKHRLDFEERYRSGLIQIPTGKSFSSSGTQTTPMGMGGGGIGADPHRQATVGNLGTQVGGGSVPIRPPLSMATQPQPMRQPIPSSASASPSLSQAIINTRGRRLAALVDKGLIDEKLLKDEDKALIDQYRSQKDRIPSRGFENIPPAPGQFGSASSSRSPVSTSIPERNSLVERPQSPTGRDIPLERPQPQSFVPPPPPPPPQSIRRSVPLPRAPQQTLRGENPLRADRILNSVGDQIDKRRTQIEGIRDKNDFRDQIQGVSDEEWENS